MFQLDLKSRKSIYQQIIDNMKELIITGILRPNERIPSVREMASILTVNPNTIQKAYRELEREGYLYTVTGQGSFVSAREDLRPDDHRIRELEARLRQDLKELLYSGLSSEQIQQMFVEILSEEGGLGK